MGWKKVLKLDRIKLERDKKRAEELEGQNPFNLDSEERAELRQTNSAKLRAKEQAHLDGREEKRKKMGLRGNISLPRGQRRHRGGRGRLGNRKLLPIVQKPKLEE